MGKLNIKCKNLLPLLSNFYFVYVFISIGEIFMRIELNTNTEIKKLNNPIKGNISYNNQAYRKIFSDNRKTAS